MKEYKVVTMNTPEEAEAEMNARAREGWEVRAVVPWNPWEGMRCQLVMTFARAGHDLCAGCLSAVC